jgi:putative ABC transport system permease protein
VRFRDVLGLALAALFRQKVRTTLTTLGVVLAAIVLVASLSARVGIQDTIIREYSRLGDLRRIEVRPNYASVKVHVPARVTTIRGSMSEARRQRLRQQAVARWPETEGQVSRPRAILDRACLETLAKLDGVRAVEPALVHQCLVSRKGKTERALTTAAPPGDPNYKDRLLAGTFFASANARAVVVSEYLLYQLGVADDADLAAVIGTKLRLEYRTSRPIPLLLLALEADTTQATVAEEQALQKVLDRLPQAVAKLDDLTAEERAIALRLLRPPKKAPEVKETVVTAELTICGVLQLAEEPRQGFRWNPAVLNPDLIVPTRTAKELYFRLPQAREHGFALVSVQVAELEDVERVSKQIDALGFQARSLTNFVRREQFTYLLVCSAMTVIAVVALLVAALGIINTMLMSVLERVREIGVMKAVGARDGHIQLMFLVEGALVGLIGGLLGLLLAWSGSFPGDAWVRATVESGLQVKLQESVFVFPWWLVVGAPLSTCLVTTVAAYYPARRAARVNPIRALRHE